MERLERNHHLNCGAIRVGNDPPVSEYVGTVDLGDDKRDTRIEPEGTAVVDHERPRPDGVRSVFPAHGGARGKERYGDPRKRIRRELMDRLMLPGECHGLPGRPRRGQQQDFTHGEPVFLKDLQHLPPDKAGRPDHGNDVLLQTVIPR